MMRTHKLDILFLQETTHVNTNTAEIHDKYCFVFSTSNSERMQTKIREQSGQRKGKGKQQSKKVLQLYNLDAEKLGTAFSMIVGI